MQLSRTKFQKSFILSTKNGLSASPGKIRSIWGENLEISLLGLWAWGDVCCHVPRGHVPPQAGQARRETTGQPPELLGRCPGLYVQTYRVARGGAPRCWAGPRASRLWPKCAPQRLRALGLTFTLYYAHVLVSTVTSQSLHHCSSLCCVHVGEQMMA